MAHTILMLQPGNDVLTKTYSDFVSVYACMRGLCHIYEAHLKQRNPDADRLEYTLNHLFTFIDELADINVLVYQSSMQTYAPFDKEWIKQQVYEMLHEKAEKTEHRRKRQEAEYAEEDNCEAAHA